MWARDATTPVFISILPMFIPDGHIDILKSVDAFIDTDIDKYIDILSILILIFYWKQSLRLSELDVESYRYYRHSGNASARPSGNVKTPSKEKL